MTTMRAIDTRRSHQVDMTALDREIKQDPVKVVVPPQAPGPTEAETMAHTAADGVNIANNVKSDVERTIDTAEREFEALRKTAYEFIQETAERQAALQARITRFTDDCVALRKGFTDVYAKIGERAEQ